MTIDEILESLTELFNKADIFDAHIIREVCNNSIYFIKQQQSELDRLQQENEQLKKMLRLVVEDMSGN